MTIGFIFLLALAVAPAFSEVVIVTADGRTFRVPVDKNEIDRIEFVSSKASSSTDPSNLKSVSLANIKPSRIVAELNRNYYAASSSESYKNHRILKDDRHSVQRLFWYPKLKRISPKRPTIILF